MSKNETHKPLHFQGFTGFDFEVYIIPTRFEVPFHTVLEFSWLCCLDTKCYVKVVFLLEQLHELLPMENIHQLHITHTLVSEIRQDLLLDDAALCNPCVLPDFQCRGSQLRHGRMYHCNANMNLLIEGLFLGVLLAAYCLLGIRKGAVGLVHLYHHDVQDRCVEPKPRYTRFFGRIRSSFRIRSLISSTIPTTMATAGRVPTTKLSHTSGIPINTDCFTKH